MIIDTGDHHEEHGCEHRRSCPHDPSQMPDSASLPNQIKPLGHSRGWGSASHKLMTFLGAIDAAYDPTALERSSSGQ
jgi:hypothetical protein